MRNDKNKESISQAEDVSFNDSYHPAEIQTFSGIEKKDSKIMVFNVLFLLVFFAYCILVWIAIAIDVYKACYFWKSWFEALSSSRWDNYCFFEAVILTVTAPVLSIYFYKWCRKIISEYLQDNHEIFTNGTEKAAKIMTVFERNYVMAMGQVHCSKCHCEECVRGWVIREDFKGTPFESLEPLLSDDGIDAVAVFLNCAVDDVYKCIMRDNILFCEPFKLLYNSYAEKKELPEFPDLHADDGRIDRKRLCGTAFEVMGRFNGQEPVYTDDALENFDIVMDRLHGISSSVSKPAMEKLLLILSVYEIKDMDTPLIPDQWDKADALIEAGEYICPYCGSKDVYIY